MLGNFSARDAKRTAHAPMRRRLRAAWLLVGWIAFWLTTAAQPFEHGFTGEPDHSSAVATSTSGGHALHAEPAPDPAPEDSHCPDVSAVTVHATSAGTAKSALLDAVYASPSSPVPVTQREGEMRSPKTYFPPPSLTTPLYLRTQRLRI